jgi:AcrR family transcriptional regulator
MLVDSLWHDLDVELFQSVEDLPELSEGRISALIDAQRRLGHLTSQQQMYLDLFASLTRQRDARRHLGELNRSYRDLHRRCLAATRLPGDELMALAGLVLAVGDGMAVSLLVRPGDFDDAAIYRLFEAMVLSLAGDARSGLGATAAPVRSHERSPRRRTATDAGVAVGPEPFGDLSPVARKLLRGARTVLRKRGFQALTLEAVAREAGEPHSAIRYYFGNKQGLINALITSQLHEQRRLAARMVGASCEDHAGAVCAARELLNDMKSFRVFFDLLPVTTREPEFRALQAEHDRWLTGLIATGLRAGGTPAVAAHADALAILEVAAADGLAMQVLTDPSGFDPQPSCAILERLISRHAPEAGHASTSLSLDAV